MVAGKVIRRSLETDGFTAAKIGRYAIAEEIRTTGCAPIRECCAVRSQWKSSGRTRR